MKEPNEEKRPIKKIIKKGGHGGHHGGAWKVAYADFVTAMMALFMVLWLVSQGDQELKEQIANYFRSPGVFTTVEGGILGGARKPNKDINANSNKSDRESLKTAAAQLRERFSKLSFAPYNDQIRIEMVDEGLIIQIIDKADQVSFESGSSQLNPITKGILDEIADTVCKLPNGIQIGGHTDAHPYPSNTYTNWELSADRANAARRQLIQRCVEPTRIKKIVGFADTQPLTAEDPFAPSNRRISIVLLFQKVEDNNFLSKLGPKHHNQEENEAQNNEHNQEHIQPLEEGHSQSLQEGKIIFKDDEIEHAEENVEQREEKKKDKEHKEHKESKEDKEHKKIGKVEDKTSKEKEEKTASNH